MFSYYSTIPTSYRTYFHKENKVFTIPVCIIGLVGIISLVLSIVALVRIPKSRSLRVQKAPANLFSQELPAPKVDQSSCTAAVESTGCGVVQNSSNESATRKLDFQMEEVGSMVLNLKRDLEYLQDQVKLLQGSHLPGLVLFALREKPVNFQELLDELQYSKTPPGQFRVEYELTFSQAIQSLNWTVQDLTGTEAKKSETWSSDRKQVLISWEYPNTKLPNALVRKFSLNLRGPTRVEEFQGWLWELGSSAPKYSSYHEFEICRLPWSLPSDPAVLHKELQSNQQGGEVSHFVLYVSDRTNDYCAYYEQLACAVPEFRQLHRDLHLVKIERGLLPDHWNLPTSDSDYPFWYTCSVSSSSTTVTGVYTGKLVDEFRSMIQEWKALPG